MYSSKQLTFELSKPQGLWFSVNDSWKNFCLPVYGGDRLAVENILVFKPTAKILTIKTKKHLIAFTNEYGIPYGHSLLTNGEVRKEAYADGQKYDFDRIGDINWIRVAKEYDAILITPHIHQCHCHRKTRWYYTWDVASGCVWNKKVVEIVI